MKKRILLSALAAALACSAARAQDISQIAKSDPLVISGAIGTSNTYYHTTGGGIGTMSPFSNTIFANLNVSIYGFSMPFSLYYSNSDFDFNYPHLSLNISPRYKHWQMYLGQSSMDYSQYVMNMSFNGVGVEYNDERLLRAGGFYGTLRRAINDDPLDPTARAPQYKRIAWGAKVGVGSRRNYLDLYFLRAYDSESSLGETWRNVVSPQENIVVGLKGQLSLKDWLSVTANAATSVFSTDSRARQIESEKAEKYDNMFTARYSSLVRFAGDVGLNVTLGSTSASLFYRMVQPDYTSLGTYYMSNNYHSVGINFNTMLARRVALSATFSGQEDNLTNKQLFTTRGFVYSANASTRIGKNLSLMAGYNGYLQNQGDGTMAVNDSTRVNRTMHSFTISPSYTVGTDGSLSHSVAASLNYTSNKDLNKYATGESDVKTLAAGASYNLGVNDWQTNFTLSFNHQSTKGYNTQYTSEIAALTGARSFLKEGNLNLAATLTLCYNHMKDVRRLATLGGDMQMGYTLKKVHMFSLAGSISKLGDMNISTDDTRYDATDISVSFNYTYTFSLLHIARKNKTAAGSQKTL